MICILFQLKVFKYQTKQVKSTNIKLSQLKHRTNNYDLKVKKVQSQINIEVKMPFSSEYKIDNTIINKYVIQSLISQAQNSSSQITIGQVFRLCDKLDQYKQNMSDKNLKIQIKSIVDAKLRNYLGQLASQQKMKPYKLNLQKIYPLNKPGNFGRVLQRKCRLVPKGVMQYQQNKQAKLKQVKSFINRIEHLQSKDLTDLPWVSLSPEKFKFRIILVDPNQNKKGVYFETYEQAEGVSAYLCYRYKKNVINGQVFAALKYQLLQSYMQGFILKINSNKTRGNQNKVKDNQNRAKDSQNNARDNQNNAKDSQNNARDNQNETNRRERQNQPIEQINSSVNQIKFESNVSKSDIDDKKNETKYISSREVPGHLNQSIDKKQQQPKRSYMSGFLDELISKHNRGNQATKSSKYQNKTSRNQMPEGAIQRIERYQWECKVQLFHKWSKYALQKSKSKHMNKSTSKMNIYDNQSQIEYQNMIQLDNRTLVTKQNTHTSRNIQSMRGSSLDRNKVPKSQYSSQAQDQKKPFSGPALLNIRNTEESRLQSSSLNVRNTEESRFQSSSLNVRNTEESRFQSSSLNVRNTEESRLQSSSLNVRNTEESRLQSSSRAKNILSHSRKQQSIFTYQEKIQQQQDLAETQSQNKNKRLGTERISFRSIQFLGRTSDHSEKQNKKQGNPTAFDKDASVFKPIVTLTAYKRNPNEKQKSKTQKNQEKPYKSLIRDKRGQFVFNTIPKKVFRGSQYQLIPTQGQGVLQTDENLSSLNLLVSVVNFLTNQEIIETQISLQEFCFSGYVNMIVDKQSSIRIKFEYRNTGVAAPQAMHKSKQHCQSSLFLCFPKIDPEIILKIKTFWQTQAVSNSYYNLQDNFNIFDAVSNSSNQAQPLSWWIDLDQTQYNYLCILQSSSMILGYKMIKPILCIVRALKNINFKIQKIIQMLLSIILNLGKPYYFPEELTKINYLHRQIGLKKGKIQLQNRVLIENLLFQKMLVMEAPLLCQKLARKNICISHLMLQYTYELFARNLSIQVLCQFWNYCSQQINKVPFIFFLTTVSLCTLLKEDMMQCKRLSQVREVLQAKKVASVTILLNQIKQLRNKYFYRGQGLIEEIKQAFQQKPFQNVLRVYYKRLQLKQADSKLSKDRYKKGLCDKLYQHVSFQDAMTLFTKPSQQPKKYTLHIYFYQLPQFSGKLILSSEGNSYQSASSERNRYFIIGEVSEQVLLKYVDFKGNVYAGQLQFNQGFNEFKIKIHCGKTNQQQSVHYLCGLLTETQIQIIKSNKKYSHFLGPNIEKVYFMQQLLKPIRQHNRSYSNQHDFMSEPWFKDLKNVFSYGNKLFNQIQYFLYLVNAQNNTLQEKMEKIRQYSLSLSKQFFLCHNQIIFKQVLFEFFKISFGGNLIEKEFQCYFNDALQNEFEAPKIIKCRFTCTNKEIKLQKQLLEYQTKKTFRNLYSDLFVDEIISVCQSPIKSKLGGSNATQGQLKVLYSSSGQVKLKVIPIKMQNKQLIIDSSRDIQPHSIFHQISQKQPQILMTEIMPSFSKISTILDYVNSSRNIDLRSKRNQQDRKVIPQGINLLKFVQNKFKNCLLLRYSRYPRRIEIPFFSYFYQLQTQVDKPKFKYYYLNNVKQSIKTICTAKQHLKFSSSNKDQDHQFDKGLGLFGNLNKITLNNDKVNSAFFWTDHREDDNIPKSLVYVNYGYGVVRWQKCLISKYRKKTKTRVNKKGNNSQTKSKIEYLVEYKEEKYFARDYEIKMNPLAKDMLEEHIDQYQTKFNQLDTDIKQGFGFLLNPSNLQEFVKSIKKN